MTGKSPESDKKYKLPTIAQIADHIENKRTVSHEDCEWCKKGA